MNSLYMSSICHNELWNRTCKINLTDMACDNVIIRCHWGVHMIWDFLKTSYIENRWGLITTLTGAWVHGSLEVLKRWSYREN